MKKITLALFLVLVFISGCATATPPFARAEDIALREKVREVVALQTNSNVVNVSVVSGTVTLSGNCLEIYGQEQRLVQAVREVEGVRRVFSTIRTCGNDRSDRDF